MPSNKEQKKKRKGSISAHLVFDLEDETLIGYMDTGDEPLPPFSKPRMKKKYEDKDYSDKN